MNRHVPRPRQDPKPSARAAPEIAFAWERFPNIVGELPPLFKRHWQEIALNQDSIPLEPDWPRYYELDLARILHVLTVRVSGLLVGYCFVIVHPHLHYASTLFAQTDIYWLDPVFRRGSTGIRMFREVETYLRAGGCKVVYVNVKLHFLKERGTLDKLFRRLGFMPTEMLYSKVL